MEDISEQVLRTVFTVGGSIASGFVVEHLRGRREIEALKAEHQDRIKALEANHEAFQAAVTWIRYKDHFVILDGEKGSGKSALLAKWLNPSIDISNVNISHSQAVTAYTFHLCSETIPEGDKLVEVQHRLRFIDVPGEALEHFPDILLETPPSIALLVVDPLALDQSLARFSPAHCSVLYGSRALAGSVKGVAIYVSKSDMDPRLVAAVTRKAKMSVAKELERYQQRIEVIPGSAKTGKGIPELQSFICSAIGVDRLFPKIRDITNE